MAPTSWTWRWPGSSWARAGLLAKAAAPLFTEALDLWFVLPALLGLIAACGLMIHVLIGQLSRRQSVNELVHGAVAQQRAPGGAR